MTTPIYGVMAEFDNLSALVNAARAAREKGYRRLDAYSPFPIEELSDALHLHKNKLPLLVLIGGIVGGTLGYMLQYFVTVMYYPINIGGRPLHSWPSYIIITFEMTMLGLMGFAFLGMLVDSGFPSYTPKEYVPEISDGKIAILFRCPDGQQKKLVDALKKVGAESVNPAEARQL